MSSCVLFLDTNSPPSGIRSTVCARFLTLANLTLVTVHLDTGYCRGEVKDITMIVTAEWSRNEASRKLM